MISAVQVNKKLKSSDLKSSQIIFQNNLQFNYLPAKVIARGREQVKETTTLSPCQ